jgi:hypothetical protein
MALKLVDSSPTFDQFTYVDTETLEETTSPFPIPGAIGNPLEEQEGTAQSGNTTFTDFGRGSGGISQYGKNLIQGRTYDAPEGDQRGDTINPGSAVRSLFNNWSLMSYKGMNGLDANSRGNTIASRYNRAINSPDDAPNATEPTARNIVQYSQDQDALSFKYNFSDFIQCEHYGQISNSYLVTLRRFAYPVNDDIMNPKQVGPDGKPVDSSQPDLARALTWMSPALGNDLKEILKFKHSLNWKEIESEVQTINESAQKRGKLGAIIDGNPLFSAIEGGVNGYGPEQAVIERDKGEGFDPLKETYPNTVFGPLNVIKKILAREQGLEFEQEFTLTFHYDLRGYGNTSPKVAFMDTMANILALTYNNAPFWGGATRYTNSGSLGKPFGDYEKLKSGDIAGFLGGLATDLKDTLSNGFDDLKGGLGDSKILDNIVGGGLMKMMNGPQGGQVVNSLLTGDPTGQWHLTIGNPMNPMMMIGNLACTDSNVSFEGPLGFEDFPSKMKVEVTLKPARMRDKGEIESMFNAGRGRMYLQPEGESIPETVNISAYGNKDRRAQGFNKDAIRKVSDMSAG